MAMKDFSQSEDDIITDINVTPFVDVVLVLLILFMLAAPSVYSTAMRVQLPTVVTGSKIPHVTLRFYLGAGGDLMLEREKITAAQVAALVKKALALDPHADAMISADKVIAHGKVLEVIDALKQAGLREVALGVENVSRPR